MRLIILLSINLWFGLVNAQTSFYVNPIINIKSNISSTSPNAFSNSFPNNPYLISKNRILTPFKNINIGLGLGYFNSDRKLSLELSYRTDECATHITEHYYSYNLMNNSFSENNLFFNYSMLLHNFNVSISKYLNNDFFAGFGVGLLMNGSHNSSGLNIIGSYGIGSTTLDTNKTLNIERTVVASYKYAFNLELTVGKKVNIGDSYISDLALIVNKSFRQLLYTHHSYLVNGQDKSYSVFNFGKGSGIYIQLSRKFQVYPWKKKDKTAHNK